MNIYIDVGIQPYFPKVKVLRELGLIICKANVGLCGVGSLVLLLTCRVEFEFGLCSVGSFDNFSG